AAVFVAAHAHGEPVALHAVDDAGDGRVARAHPLGERGEAEVAEGFEHLDRGDLGAREAVLTGDLLRGATALRVQVHERLDDAIDVFFVRRRGVRIGVPARAHLETLSYGDLSCAK